MCGIFVYMGHRPFSITKAIQALHILETQQEPGEPTPVGGHGAGIAYLNPKKEFTLVKVGKTQRRSPVHDLKQKLLNLTATQSQVILGHVRRASPEFSDTIRHAECAQPYKPHCTQNLNIVSAHNGYLANYLQLRAQLHTNHHFESEPVKLIDSEIMPHIYEEQLIKTQSPTRAAHALYEQAEGRNTVIALHENPDTDQTYLSVIQKGKTRGLVIWATSDNAVLLCSREKPVRIAFSEVLKENNCHKTIHITHNDSLHLEAHFSLDLKLQSPCQ